MVDAAANPGAPAAAATRSGVESCQKRSLRRIVTARGDFHPVI